VPETTESGPTLDGVLRDLAEYINHELDEGRRAVEVSPDVIEPFHEASFPARADVPASGLAGVAERIAGCTQCSLHRTRTRGVPGQGSATPEIMCIGEAPGADEDRQGLAFVGRAGQLLTKMIEAMGYTRDEVFIGNILKCRPPGNRNPLPEEMETCMPYLLEQIEILQPKVIIALGSIAAKGLLDTTMGITRLRGQWKRFQGIDLMPTYHPAYLLRNPGAKRDVWNDLQEVLRHLGRPIPEVKKRR